MRLTLLLMALAACTPVVEATATDPARSVILPAVAATVSREDLARTITDCVIANATNAETVRIATDATKIEGPAPDIAELIAEIITRPETQACVRARSA